jgi:formamidopyrimidine-DNA glycosylase
MPELPEVETVVRRIRPSLEGRTVEALEVIDARWAQPLSPSELERHLNGRNVQKVSRRGKYILVGLDSGQTLVMHLRMTGTILINPDEQIGHERAEFALSDGTKLVFNDPRRFGTAELVATALLDNYFAGRLGLEPFDSGFTPDHFFGLTRSRKAPLKSFLLDQKLIAGIGNIYADEALFRAGLHPLRQPHGLNRQQSAALRLGVIDALQAGIDAGGATIDDFRNPDGAWGAYQSEFLVHRREGKDCPTCGSSIVKFKVGGRATYCCEACQKRPSRVRR